MKDSGQIISADVLRSEVQDATDADAEVELREFIVTAAQHGERLDRVLAQAVPEFSRSYLQQLLLDGAVHVGGALALKPASRVRVQDRCTIALRPTPQSRAFVAEPIALAVVYEDKHLLVINKPAGLVVHPAPGNWSGTLLNGLLAYHPGFADLPRAGIVHRLDKDTSGLMLVARSRQSMEALVRMISAREVHRQYLALAHRVWTGARVQEVRTPIGRDVGNRLRMAVVDHDRGTGKAAHTGFELLGNAEHGCLVRCTLHTGRTHQIRVHMASLGHPLVADATYGGAPAAGMRRQALHARSLALTHPVGGEALEFLSPIPADLQAALQAWGLGYNLSQRQAPEHGAGP